MSRILVARLQPPSCPGIVPKVVELAVRQGELSWGDRLFGKRGPIEIELFQPPVNLSHVLHGNCRTDGNRPVIFPVLAIFPQAHLIHPAIRWTANMRWKPQQRCESQ